MMFDAQRLERLRQGRIRVLRQVNPAGPAGSHSLAKLLGTHNKPFLFSIGQVAVLGDFTVFFLIHTNLYYTQFTEKVNKNVAKFSAFQGFSLGKSDDSPKITVHGGQSSMDGVLS